MSWMRYLVILPLALVIGGCIGRSGRMAPLGPDAFYDGQGEDRSAQAEAPRASVRVEADGQPQGPNRIVSTRPVGQTTPAATTGPAGMSAGTTAQYLTVGAVVCEVSGAPIYADKVLAALTPLLSAQAKQRDLQSYKALARIEIEKQVNAMIRAELEYKAAMQNLGQDDITLAENLTMMWRQRQITEAGGSLELARRKAAAEGMDFDEKVREQNRTYLVQLFYQKKVYPRVQISAQDMRRYYDQHLKNEFTEMDQAQIRLIKIEARKMGGREQAIDKIRDLHQRAVRGDDFEKLAGSFNHDPALLRTAGRVGGADGWIHRGSLAVQKIEDAIWQLQPGQVSDVIEVGDSFYIAKLENRKPGRVRAFEDEDVQKQIRQTLERVQIAAQREKVQEKLLKDAVIYPYPPDVAPVLEMAMQKYWQWRAG